MSGMITKLLALRKGVQGELVGLKDDTAEWFEQNGFAVPKSYLGSGYYASAYLTRNGTVLKVTEDESDANALSAVAAKKGTLKALVRVYRVGRVVASKGGRQHGLWLIEMEKLKVEPDDPFVELVVDTFYQAVKTLELRTYDVFDFLSNGAAGLVKPLLINECASELDQKPADVKKAVDWLFLLAAGLKKAGITQYSDIHHDNLGYNDSNQLVAFDLGAKSNAQPRGIMDLVAAAQRR